MILDETRERFIKAMAREVDPARIAEVHFFAPIRQGGVESGVAVIAARHSQDAARSDAADSTLDAEEESPYSDDVERSAASDRDPSEVPPSQNEEGDVSANTSDAPATVDDAPVDATDGAVGVSDASADATEASGDTMEANDGEGDDDTPVSTPIERHVIYTARYRLTLKGPDRGKWETNVTAEADAPIITVDAVVRGVQRRAGDVDDPTRMTGEEIRSALPAAV